VTRWSVNPDGVTIIAFLRFKFLLHFLEFLFCHCIFTWSKEDMELSMILFQSTILLYTLLVDCDCFLFHVHMKKLVIKGDKWRFWLPFFFLLQISWSFACGLQCNRKMWFCIFVVGFYFVFELKRMQKTWLFLAMSLGVYLLNSKQADCL